MQVNLKKNETFEKLLRRFKKQLQKDDRLNTYRQKQEFVPKSIKRQQQKANKLRKSREQDV
jgi:ribosomal protein S21|tara:strand:+ start:6571 stop:6753 length:183 start_codon:yes stop_codon:yes gene_type:complete